MALLDWLRGTAPQTPEGSRRPRRCDRLAETVEHAEKANAEALAVVNESRQRRGAPPLDWADLLDEPIPRREAS